MELRLRQIQLGKELGVRVKKALSRNESSGTEHCMGAKISPAYYGHVKNSRDKTIKESLFPEIIYSGDLQCAVVLTQNKTIPHFGLEC